MAARFILGRAGSGKTTHCLDRIAALVKADPLGPPIYWVLPRQATFQAERELTCRLRAFTRVRVVSFELLGQEILSACGDVGMPQVTAAGRRLIVGHVLRQHQNDLRFYSASARHPGLAGELDAIFGEIDQAGLDSASLKTALDSADSPLPESLDDKLHDLQLLMRGYEAFLGSDRLDPGRRFRRVLERVSQCSKLSDATLFVDDFFDFTANERSLLVAVTKAVKSADITLLIDPASRVVFDPNQYPDELSPLHRTERTYRSLYWAMKNEGVPVEPPVKLTALHRTDCPDLVHLQRDENVAFTSEPKKIEWLEAPDARAEVNLVARKIDDLLAGGKLRRRDIAVLVRSMGTYQERIEASFREHAELRYFIDRRRPATHHPLLRFCRGALMLADGKWAVDDVMPFLKTGLAGVSDAQADALENYAERHRIRGARWASPEPWQFRGEDFSIDPATDIDIARRAVAEKLRPMLELFTLAPSPGTPEEGRGEGELRPSKMARPTGNHPHPNPLPEYQERGPEGSTVHAVLVELFALLDRFGVRKTLSSWISAAESNGQIEQAAEHRAVWAELTELLQHFDELLGDTVINLDDFLSILDAGLERFDLGLTPPTVDQIIVGEIGRTRLPEVKVVFVLGLNERNFPQLGTESSVLSDSERRVLHERQIDVSQGTDRQLLDEKLLAYVAFTRPSQRLVVSRYTTEGGGKATPTNPSTFWTQLLTTFPKATVQQVSRTAEPAAADIATPRQLVTALMRWARTGDDTGPWPALYGWFRETKHAPVEHLKHTAWPALSYRNEATLPDGLSASMFPAPLRTTAKELESQANCPYQHFARFGLSLKRQESPDVTGGDEHVAYHRALQKFGAGLLQDEVDWAELLEGDIDDRLAPLVQEIGETLRGQILLGTARARYLLYRIGKMLRLTIQSQQAFLSRGRYRPEKIELKFDDEGEFPPLQLPGKAELHGAIDRLDRHENGRSFSLIDYAFRAKPLSPADVLNGLSLQAVVAMLAVRENASVLSREKSAVIAALTLAITRSPRAVLHPSDAMSPGDPDFHLQSKPRGIVDQRALSAFDPQTDTGTSPVLAFSINKDGHPGRLSSTDVASAEQMTALLNAAKDRATELADAIIDGDIKVAPYRIGQKSPCVQCAYRSVCRFEPGINNYRHLPGGRRDEVLDRLIGKERGDVE